MTIQANLFSSLCPLTQAFVDLMKKCAAFDALSYSEAKWKAELCHGKDFADWISHKCGKKGYYDKSIFVLVACGADRMNTARIAQMLGLKDHPMMDDSREMQRWRIELGQKFYCETISYALFKLGKDRGAMQDYMKKLRIPDGGNGNNWTKFAIVSAEMEEYKKLFNLNVLEEATKKAAQ
ncbi:MAG: hypothetical protein RLZZ628_1780 [Bacteroidota bacterium]|jgi:hypothetical protein